MNYRSSHTQTVYILGAGPAGLAAAYTLTKKSIPVVIIEKSDRVGGLSKSIDYRGFIVDYGAHFLATDHPVIGHIFDKILVSEQVKIDRLTSFYWRARYFSYPPQIKEVFLNVSLIEVIKIISSYLISKVFAISSPQNHAEELQNKYGKYLYEIFFKGYLEKVWGCSCDELALDSVTGRANGLVRTWLETLSRKVTNLFARKKAPKNYEYQFQYPKLGLGQFYEKIADYLRSQNQKIFLNTEVVEIHHQDSRITRLVLKNCQNNELSVHNCDRIISSVPISLLVKLLVPAISKEVITAVKSLKFRNTVLVYLIVEDSQIFPEHCLYINEPKVDLVRVTNYANWSSHTLPNNYQTPICCEYWSDFEDKTWSLSEQELLTKAERELRQISIIGNKQVSGGFVVKLPHTNPVYNTDYKKKKAQILQYTSQFNNLKVIGRSGSFNYVDQDRALLMGIHAAEELTNITDRNPANERKTLSE